MRDFLITIYVKILRISFKFICVAGYQFEKKNMFSFVEISKLFTIIFNVAANGFSSFMEIARNKLIPKTFNRIKITNCVYQIFIMMSNKWNPFTYYFTLKLSHPLNSFVVTNFTSHLLLHLLLLIQITKS